MEGKYDVTYRNRRVGEVRLCRKGLYIQIHCVCEISGNELYRLYMSEHCLGTLCPEKGTLTLHTQKSCRSLMGHDTVFTVRSKDQAVRFVPFSDLENIEFLHQILEARFYVRDGISGLILPPEK